MPSSGILRLVALVRTKVSEESSATMIRVTRIGELGTTLAVTSNLRTLRRNTSIRSTKLVFLTRATRHNIPGDGIIQLKFYFLADLPFMIENGRFPQHHFLF
jgi:hypothetical protein